jgi:hypothetical protein
MNKRQFQINNYPGFRLGNYFLVVAMSLAIMAGSCSKTDPEPVKEEEVEEPDPKPDPPQTPDKVEGVDYFLPKIDLSHWKVTLPIGKPTEVEPPEILEYATNETLMPFMYNDSTDGSLVFYTFPDESTANSKYSRTELREQVDPGSNTTNWTFTEGGRMKGKLKVSEITKDASEKFHRTIIMQIHGRLTNEQRDLIGKDDNDAPPMLKIYWQNEKVRVVTKVLKDPDNTDIAYILTKDSWTDDAGHYFDTEVGNNEFTLEVIASDGKLEVILNETESVVYQDIHKEKWSVFENYFKAGNYLQTLDPGASAKVKYYDLVVSH